MQPRFRLPDVGCAAQLLILRTLRNTPYGVFMRVFCCIESLYAFYPDFFPIYPPSRCFMHRFVRIKHLPLPSNVNQLIVVTFRVKDG